VKGAATAKAPMQMKAADAANSFNARRLALFSVVTMDLALQPVPKNSALDNGICDMTPMKRLWEQKVAKKSPSGVNFLRNS
jgi:hypothetical protein